MNAADVYAARLLTEVVVLVPSKSAASSNMYMHRSRIEFTQVWVLVVVRFMCASLPMSAFFEA